MVFIVQIGHTGAYAAIVVQGSIGLSAKTLEFSQEARRRIFSFAAKSSEKKTLAFNAWTDRDPAAICKVY